MKIKIIYKFSYVVAGSLYFGSILATLYFLITIGSNKMELDFLMSTFLSLFIFFQTAKIYNYSYVFKNERDVF